VGGGKNKSVRSTKAALVLAWLLLKIKILNMKKLHELVKERTELERELYLLRREFDEKREKLTKQINELSRLETIGVTGIEVGKVQLAESILEIRGEPWNIVDGRNLIDCAVEDIANGCQHLKREFFGNKRYEGYYQACDCNYGYGPKHGGIVDEVGLQSSARKRELTDEEKDACIYYLRNYKKIKAVKKQPA
jgi:hypothetical protein